GCSRHYEPFSILGKGCLMACCLGSNVAGCLELAVEGDLQQATPEWSQKHAAIVRIGEQHRANARIRQKVEVTLEAGHATAVTHNRNAISAVYYQAHPIGRVLAESSLGGAARQQIFCRNQLLAVGQLAQRKLELHVTDQITGR